jgi:SWI/SNF-related matrix-associated actin-dependent regulator of chromatin subfamily A3
MLVYTPKGNIPVVGSYLHSCGLFLDHPTYPPDFLRPANYHYYNPHNPPPGGYNRALPPSRPGNGSPGNMVNRWSTPVISGKSVEVQRSQVDELFKSLKTGDELAETEPCELYSCPAGVSRLNLIQVLLLFMFPIHFFVI